MAEVLQRVMRAARRDGTQTRIGFSLMVHWYQCTIVERTMKAPKQQQPRPHPIVVERVQTGVRLEKRLLKVLKGLAEYLDLSLGDLLEGIALHALEGKAPFSEA